jgi:hypothetical protein
MPASGGDAREIWSYTRQLEVESQGFVSLLPVSFRLFALAGQIDEAIRIRRDLSGELGHAAILHYNRRNYGLAAQYIDLVLQQDPRDWRMRLGSLRIR